MQPGAPARVLLERRGHGRERGVRSRVADRDARGGRAGRAARAARAAQELEQLFVRRGRAGALAARDDDVDERRDGRGARRDVGEGDGRLALERDAPEDQAAEAAARAAPREEAADAGVRVRAVEAIQPERVDAERLRGRGVERRPRLEAAVVEAQERARKRAPHGARPPPPPPPPIQATTALACPQAGDLLNCTVSCPSAPAPAPVKCAAASSVPSGPGVNFGFTVLGSVLTLGGMAVFTLGSQRGWWTALHARITGDSGGVGYSKQAAMGSSSSSSYGST